MPVYKIYYAQTELGTIITDDASVLANAITEYAIQEQVPYQDITAIPQREN